MPPRIGVEGRDAHQPVHAALGLEPAIGVAALDAHGGGFEPRLLARRLLDIFDLEAMLLGPARIHAQQHLRPILALGSAGPGVNLEEAVVGIRLARQQRLGLSALGFRLERVEYGFGFLDHLGVALGLAELDHGELVLELLLDARDRAEVLLERGALLHLPLGALLVLPPLAVLGLPVGWPPSCFRSIEVKDASSAARRTA